MKKKKYKASPLSLLEMPLSFCWGHTKTRETRRALKASPRSVFHRHPSVIFPLEPWRVEATVHRKENSGRIITPLYGERSADFRWGGVGWAVWSTTAGFDQDETSEHSRSHWLELTGNREWGAGGHNPESISCHNKVLVYYELMWPRQHGLRWLFVHL